MKRQLFVKLFKMQFLYFISYIDFVILYLY